MSESRRKNILYLFLLVACIWGWYNIGPNSTNEKSDTAKLPVKTIAALQPNNESEQQVAPLDTTVLSNNSWGADPFVRLEQRLKISTNVNVSWVLSGISYNKTAPIAFINQKLVKVGDRVNKAVVIAIEKKSVTLELQGARFELTVTEG